jgi:hypothetical protein
MQPRWRQKPVWSKYSNGLKWRGLGFSPSSLFEWTSPIQKQRLQSYLSRSLRLRGIRDALACLLAYVTGIVNQELLLRNEYLAAESRILRGQIKGGLLLSEGEKATLAEIGQRLGRRALEDVAATAKPDTILGWYGKLVANKSDGSKFRRSVGAHHRGSDSIHPKNKIRCYLGDPKAQRFGELQG